MLFGMKTSRFITKFDRPHYHQPERPRDIEPPSVLDGTSTVRAALMRQAERSPALATSSDWLQDGDLLDPVLAHHLRRTRL
jgi:hypothetical protein